MNYETKIGREATTLDYQGEPTAARSNRWLLIVVALAIVAALGLAYYFYESNAAPAGGAVAEKGKGKGKQVPRVTVTVPGRQVVANMISATGTIAARNEMPVSAVGEGGLVSKIWVEEGNWVRAGQVLVSIDRSVQGQESNQLSAGIVAAQSDARLAQAELDRARALLDRGFISKADIDRKTAARDAARARVAVAQAQLGANRARINRLDIRAPSDGLVLSRTIELGQVVSAGSGVLFRIARGGQMELRAQVGEAELVKLSVGQTASVIPVGSAQTYTGQIWQVSPIINAATRQGIARVALAYDRALRPGGFASAQIASGSADVPLLPESAVQTDAKGTFVLVVGANDKVERRDVKPGQVNNNGVPIIEGLSGQEMIVVNAGAFLNPGETIRPVKAKPAN
jgi:HlyD family secretion protein